LHALAEKPPFDALISIDETAMEREYRCFNRMQGVTMDSDLLRAAQHLSSDAVVTLDGAPGRRVAVLRGRLWVTVDHDLADHVLAPGQSFTAHDARRLTLSAFEPSDYLVLDRERA
jgi:Protein of unknown function (DUF2917)